jgi:methionine aminopeptidase
MGKMNQLSDIRRAFADYVASEGCSCCRDIDGHNEAAERLAKLLRVPKYKDGSGYDFYRYKTKKG